MQKNEDQAQPREENPLLKCVRQADALLRREVARMGAAFLESYPKDASAEEKSRAHAHFMDLLLTYYPRFQRCVTIPFAVWLTEARKAADEGQKKEGQPKGEGC